MVRMAKTEGVGPTARAFQTTPKTVRKWLARFDGSLDSLAERSRRPRHSPNKTPEEDEKSILAAKKKLPNWSARRLKTDLGLPYSVKVIRRVCKEHGFTRKYRRKKHETKRCLREVKKHWRLFQQIDIDTKDLSDIPEYWYPMAHGGLPRYQYTARDVTTGLLFLGYSNELGLAYATFFAQNIIAHLRACGLDLSQTTWQSDNGSEFIGSWQAKEPSAFTRAVEAVRGQVHRTIPPGQHRYQADVETVHSLMETEFYEVQSFTNRADFISQAQSYAYYFNVARTNSGKEGKTPWQLIQNKTDSPPPEMLLFDVLFLDEEYHRTLHNHSPGGYHVRALP